MNVKHLFIILGLIIAFPYEVYSHTLVDAKCDITTIYEYKSETTQNNEPILIETDNDILKIQTRSEGWDIHELEIISKSNPIQSVQLQFEGPVFEITTLELDDTALGKEFMVTDKPSTQGYRYSLIPSPQVQTVTTDLHLWELWSLPEHDYPMFTDLNNDQVCEILDFHDDYISAFKYPSFMVTSNAYHYDAKRGQLELDSSLTKQHIQTQWEDELYRYEKLIRAIAKAERKDEIDLQIYEFGIESVFATRFLYTAKQVGKFPEAISKLKHLMLEFNNLEGKEYWSLAPFSWSIWGEISFDDFKDINEDTGLFSNHEMQDIKLIFAMMNKS